MSFSRSSNPQSGGVSAPTSSACVVTLRRWEQEPADLAVEHADELGTLGDRDAEQLLGREREGVLLVHRRDVVQAIEVGHRA